MEGEDRGADLQARASFGRNLEWRTRTISRSRRSLSSPCCGGSTLCPSCILSERGRSRYVGHPIVPLFLLFCRDLAATTILRIMPLPSNCAHFAYFLFCSHAISGATVLQIFTLPRTVRKGYPTPKPYLYDLPPCLPTSRSPLLLSNYDTSNSVYSSYFARSMKYSLYAFIRVFILLFILPLSSSTTPSSSMNKYISSQAKRQMHWPADEDPASWCGSGAHFVLRSK